jgi:hypothetical protein
MKDSTGTPYTGSKLVKFTLYDGVGTEIWNSGFNSTTFADGLVTVELGAPPHPALPTGSWRTDTALTLGITVDTDPEIAPRIPFNSTGYAFHAGTADSLTGFDAMGFVRKAGDTMSGPLNIVSQPGWGADSASTSLMVSSHSKAWHTIGDGLGDVRIGDSTFGLSIGVDTATGLKGWTTIWSEGEREIIRLASRTSSSQLVVDGNTDHVYTWSNFSVNSTLNKTGLSVLSGNNWRWDVGAGNGDIYLGSNTTGLRIGHSTSGAGSGSARFWTDGGLVNLMTFGSPVAGDVLRIDADSNNVRTYGELGVGTGTSPPVAPLHVRSQNQYRWDIGDGLGDVLIEDGSGGLSIGVAPSGEVSFWSSGGTFENISIGSPTTGDMLRFEPQSDQMSIYQDTYWWDSTGNFGLWALPDAHQFSVMGGTDHNNKVTLLGNADFGSIWMYDSNVVATAVLEARTLGGGGALQLSRRDGSAGASLAAGADGTGSRLLLYDGGGTPQIELRAGEPGDFSVTLPDSAISNSEILDEPGLAFNRRTTLISNLAKSNTSQDFVSVNITTPADGYVAVEGVGYFSCQGDDAAFGWAQVSETSNRVQESGQFHWVGPTGFGNTSGDYTYHSIPIKRFYFKAQGSYTFYLQGNAYVSNAVSSDVDLLAPTWLQATYYPVAYGTASTLAESAGDFESATQVSVKDPLTGKASQVYRVDLRELELKSKAARLKALEAQQDALKAELELQRARMKDSDSPIVHAGQIDSEVQQ